MWRRASELFSVICIGLVVALLPQATQAQPHAWDFIRPYFLKNYFVTGMALDMTDQDKPPSLLVMGYKPVQTPWSGSVIFRISFFGSSWERIEPIAGPGTSNDLAQEGPATKIAIEHGSSHLVVRPNGDIAFIECADGKYRLRLLNKQTGILRTLFVTHWIYPSAQAGRDPLLIAPQSVSVNRKGQLIVGGVIRRSPDAAAGLYVVRLSEHAGKWTTEELIGLNQKVSGSTYAMKVVNHLTHVDDVVEIGDDRLVASVGGLDEPTLLEARSTVDGGLDVRTPLVRVADADLEANDLNLVPGFKRLHVASDNSLFVVDTHRRALWKLDSNLEKAKPVFGLRPLAFDGQVRSSDQFTRHAAVLPDGGFIVAQDTGGNHLRYIDPDDVFENHLKTALDAANNKRNVQAASAMASLNKLAAIPIVTASDHRRACKFSDGDLAQQERENRLLQLPQELRNELCNFAAYNATTAVFSRLRAQMVLDAIRVDSDYQLNALQKYVEPFREPSFLRRFFLGWPSEPDWY